MRFEKVTAEYDDTGRRRLIPTGEEPVFMECDQVLLAIGQMNAFPWIKRAVACSLQTVDYPCLTT